MKKTLIALTLAGAFAAPAAASACTSVEDKLTASHTAVVVTCVPAGATSVWAAESNAATGGTTKYHVATLKAEVGQTFSPKTAGYEWAGMVAHNGETQVGGWPPRLQVSGTSHLQEELEHLEGERSAGEAQAAKLRAELVSVEASLHELATKIEQVEAEIAAEKAEEPPAEEPPLEEPPAEEPFSHFKKGVDGGGWGLSNELTDYKKLGPEPNVRLENPGSTSSLTGAGISVTYLLNHYNTGGVKAINVASYVKEAEAEVAQNPTDALEVLNEPGGNWFWGSGAESEANAAAYDNLLKEVHAHLPKAAIEASFDGGHAGDNAWGRKMLKADPHVTEYVTTFTEHPYDGSGANPASTLVHWGAVQEAHELTGKSISITEYGRPLQATTGDSPKSTESQQATADGAMVKKGREVGWVREVDIYGYRGNGSPCYAVFAENGTPRPAVSAIAAG